MERAKAVPTSGLAASRAAPSLWARRPARCATCARADGCAESIARSSASSASRSFPSLSSLRASSTGGESYHYLPAPRAAGKSVRRMASWFVFFALSGFCGLLYETLWLRLSMAEFGVTSPSLAITLSVFMGGLALGSWLVSRAAGKLSALDARGATRAYALAELGIAALAFPAPWLLRSGGALLSSVLAGRGPAAWYAAAFAWQGLVL